MVPSQFHAFLALTEVLILFGIFLSRGSSFVQILKPCPFSHSHDLEIRDLRLPYLKGTTSYT